MGLEGYNRFLAYRDTPNLAQGIRTAHIAYERMNLFYNREIDEVERDINDGKKEDAKSRLKGLHPMLFRAATNWLQHSVYALLVFGAVEPTTPTGNRRIGKRGEPDYAESVAQQLYTLGYSRHRLDKLEGRIRTAQTLADLLKSEEGFVDFVNSQIDSQDAKVDWNSERVFFSGNRLLFLIATKNLRNIRRYGQAIVCPFERSRYYSSKLEIEIKDSGLLGSHLHQRFALPEWDPEFANPEEVRRIEEMGFASAFYDGRQTRYSPVI